MLLHKFFYPNFPAISSNIPPVTDPTNAPTNNIVTINSFWKDDNMNSFSINSTAPEMIPVKKVESIKT